MIERRWENKAESVIRLVEIAKGDTGQSEIVANFLLSWWNADACKGFNMTQLWAVDEAIYQDILVTIQLIRETRSYPDQLGYLFDFAEMEKRWRR